ncbi:FeoB-associated Cys-rich membrane protein [Faecalimonas canis]
MSLADMILIVGITVLVFLVVRNQIKKRKNGVSA